MRLIRKLSVRFRLLFALLCVSVIPAIFVGGYAYRSHINSVTEKLSVSAEETIRLLDSKLMAEIARHGLFIDAISIADEVQTALYKPNYDRSFSDVIEGIILRSGYFRSLCIMDNNGSRLYDEGYSQVSDEVLEDLRRRAEAASPHDSLTHVSGSRTDNLSIGRKIYHFPEGVKPIGYIMVFVNEALVRDVLRDVSFGGGAMVLMSPDGTVLAGDMARPGTNLKDTELYNGLMAASLANEKSFLADADGISSLIVFNHNPQYDTYLLAAIPLSYINDDAGPTGRRIAIFALVSALSCILFAMLIYRSVERRKRELELKALQYQINPHFLFNTLSTLKWAAIINDAPAVISEGITSLAKLLQSVLLSKNEMVPLKEELDNLTHYFTIQNIRYADCVAVEYEVDDTLLNCLVPRFILQPLAENAVLHGSEGGERKIIVTVMCHRAGNDVLLEIKDNGCGFDQINTSASCNSSIGLHNVDERLKLYFGSGHGLKIHSIVGEGTLCSIIIPNAGKESKHD